MAETPVYVHVAPESALPDLTHLSPYRTVLIIDSAVSDEWQIRASRWLVESGCLYMMAWGLECSSWDDTVDYANMEQFDYGDIPLDRDVFTTWHDDEPLEEALDFCKRHARHPAVELHHTVLLHIAVQSDSQRILQSFAAA